jgi:transposase InsO family protein
MLLWCHQHNRAAFVTDVYSRRIVGWNVAATLKAEILSLQALDMAAWEAGGDLAGLTHHSDHGSNYMAMVYTELGAIPSTGTVGDSFDNAMAEAVNGLYKTELIRQRGPWKTVEQVELATLEYVWWMLLVLSSSFWGCDLGEYGGGALFELGVGAGSDLESPQLLVSDPE